MAARLLRARSRDAGFVLVVPRLRGVLIPSPLSNHFIERWIAKQMGVRLVGSWRVVRRRIVPVFSLLRKSAPRLTWGMARFGAVS